MKVSQHRKMDSESNLASPIKSGLGELKIQFMLAFEKCPLFSQRRLCFNAVSKHWNKCSTSYGSVWNQASTLGPRGFINTDSSDVKSQDTKLCHPTVKLLQCAESKEETELNSNSCVHGAVFHMSTKDPNSWRRGSILNSARPL